MALTTGGDNAKFDQKKKEYWDIESKLFALGGALAGLTRIVTFSGFAKTFWANGFRIGLEMGFIDLGRSVVSTGIGAGFLALATAFPSKTLELIDTVATQITKLEGPAEILSARVMNQILGENVDQAAVRSAITDKNPQHRVTVLGREFSKILPVIFDEKVTKAGWDNRNPFQAGKDNMARFFGTNLSFQMRSLAISTVAGMTSLKSIHALENLHQSVNWAYGFGWMSWTVLSNIMDLAVTRPMRIGYMAQYLPEDLTENETYRAFHAGKINQALYDTRLNNEGVRKDVRPIRLAFHEKAYDDTEMTALFHQGKLTAPQITSLFRLQGFGADRAKQKTDIIVQGRTWKLLDDITHSMAKLFRDDVVTEAEYRQTLTDAHYTTAEADLKVALVELERKQRTFMTTEQLCKAFEQGIMGPNEIADYLEVKGYTPLDRLIISTSCAFHKLPAACTDTAKEIDFARLLLQILQHVIGSGVIPNLGEVFKLLKCLGAPHEAELIEAVAVKVEKAPSVAFAATPGSVTAGDMTRLSWRVDSPDLPTTQEIQGLGAVPPQGVRFVAVNQNTIWKLTAKNKAGTTERFTSVLVHPVKPPAPPKAKPAPSASIQVSPSSAHPGDPIEVRWTTAHADKVFLDNGDGPVVAPETGAKVIVADHTRIFTLTATGEGGQRSSADALRVLPPVGVTTKGPVASLSVSPLSVTKGEEYQVSWETKNATEIKLEGLDTPEAVGPSGTKILVSDRDRVFTLRARNPQADLEAIDTDAIIVKEPGAPTEPTLPKPTVSLTIRPSRAKKGVEVAVEWRTTHADEVTLQRTAGTTSLATYGAMTIVADATETMILKAKGKGGEVAVAKVLIVHT